MLGLKITWTDITTAVRATAVTVGVRHTITVETTESNDAAADAQTFVLANVTANDGPNVWSAANFDTGNLPANGDTVWIENSTVDILYNLDQSAVTLTALNTPASYTAYNGLPRQNVAGYLDYRDEYLRIGATTINIGAGTGTGSGRIKIDTGSVQTTVNVYLSAISADSDSGLEAILWKGTHASNVLNVLSGTVGVAVFGGEAATIATTRVGYTNNPIGDATVRLGVGVTLTTVEQSGSTLTTQSNITTLTMTDGELTHAAGTVTTLNVDGGVAYYTSTGTCTTGNVSSGGRLDFTRDTRPRTFTNCNLFSGGEIRDPHKSVTFTNGIDLERSAIGDVEIDLGTHVRLTVGAPS